MKQELENSFGKVFITLEEDPQNKWLHVTWTGYLTEDNLKQGAEAFLAALAKAGFHNVLNDSRAVIGTWEHSMDWVMEKWVPAAVKAGLKNLAIVRAPESLAATTVSKFQHKITGFKIEVFDDLEPAKAWLKDQN